MSKPVELSHKQWIRLKAKLKEDYPSNLFLIKSRMKNVLGFTPRDYKEWDSSIGPLGSWSKNCIMLDFYSEKKRTWFMIKYSEYIQKE